MFKRVLLALDFSGLSMGLFNSLPDLMKLGLKELLLVHAVRVELSAKDGINPIQLKFLEQLKQKRSELEKEGLNVDIEVPVGAPAEEIKRLAEQRDVDLILIGSLGEGSRFRELFLGSTVADVIRISPVPVLVEKYQAKEEGHRRVPIFTEKLASLLLPTDFSASAEYVYRTILKISDKLHEVVLLYVIDRGNTVDNILEASKNAEEKLEQWKEKFIQKGVSARYYITGGPPGQQIINTAKKERVTLIALSRRGKGNLAGLLIGSTANQVIRLGETPVLLFGNCEKVNL